MLNKKKSKTWIWWGLLILIAFIDINSSFISWIPIIGDILANLGNMLFEIIELGIVFGLVKSSRGGK